MTKVASDVSIVSANFNNGDFLADYFESIINSNMLPQECIICDDGSSDKSVEIIEKYAQQFPWIKPIFFKENKGVAHATNAALKEAKSLYILRLDSDDYILPNRIEQQLEFMISHPQVDVLGGNCIYFDSETGKDMHRSNFFSEPKKIKNLYHIGENGVLNGTTMVKKKWFDKIQYRQEMVWAEDYDLFARMLHEGANFHGQGKALTKVRIHRSSATSNLEFDTLKKAHDLSKELFNNPASGSAIRRNYKHLIHYRKYMMSNNPIVRLSSLLLSILYRPDKMINRILKR